MGLAKRGGDRRGGSIIWCSRTNGTVVAESVQLTGTDERADGPARRGGRGCLRLFRLPLPCCCCWRSRPSEENTDSRAAILFHLQRHRRTWRRGWGANPGTAATDDDAGRREPLLSGASAFPGDLSAWVGVAWDEYRLRRIRSATRPGRSRRAAMTLQKRRAGRGVWPVDARRYRSESCTRLAGQTPSTPQPAMSSKSKRVSK